MSSKAESITRQRQEPRIENVEKVIETLEDYNSLLPNGDRMPVEVDNPRLDRHDPRYLRVSVYRKGMTFEVIEVAREFGLVVADVWQLDKDRDADRVCFKLVPEESY